MVTFGEKENAIIAYIFMKPVWHILPVKAFHFWGSFLKKLMDKSFAFQIRTDITLNFLTSDWFVHYTENTKGKQCGWIFSSRGSHADFPTGSRTP